MATPPLPFEDPPLRGESLIEPVLAVKARPDSADPSPAEAYDLWPAFEAFVDAQPNIRPPDQFALPRYHRSSDWSRAPRGR